MDITLNLSDKTAVMQLSGKLDMTNSHKLKEAFSKINTSEFQKVVLDFTNLEMIDSSGIGKILVFHKKIRENDGSILIKNPNTYIREVFELIQLNKLIDITN